MSHYESVLPIWSAIQSRFFKTASQLPQEDLTLKIGPASIGYMLQHNAEVEYMFTEWYFRKPMPEHIKLATSGGPGSKKSDFSDLNALLQMLGDSNEHLRGAMCELPEEEWTVPVESPMGGPATTPLEAVGRLMYHTGIHAGQISLIQKNARVNQS
ncbi:DinB family protein [Paenibacillus rhizovicinus]|uniref:DinB family protein n=1 Tax=Paenibacillus rhizovicinus TaxID=2704463 RepID=A0A6C0P6V2_9BACL|nr:DinB family protein [Paenibacillus rhizovicinus]QHW34076.1 DinB family protein [Paenibacillus rhizovicinus]